MINIEISDDIYEMLEEIKEKNETIDDLLGRLLDAYYEEVNEKKINSNIEEEYDEDEW